MASEAVTRHRPLRHLLHTEHAAVHRTPTMDLHTGQSTTNAQPLTHSAQQPAFRYASSSIVPPSPQSNIYRALLVGIGLLVPFWPASAEHH